MNKKYLFYDKIFKKLYYNEGSSILMNTGWGDTNIILYKGAHSSIEFVVVDHDRKPILLRGRNIRIRLINFQTKELLLEKNMIVVDPYNGRVKLILTPGDTADWDEGIIEYYVLISNEDDNESYYLYNDFAQGATGYINLKNTFSLQTPNVQRLVDFKPENIDNETFFISNIFKGPVMLGYNTPFLTISIRLENFSGKIFLQGTMDPVIQSTSNVNWFTIQLEPGFDYITFNNETFVHAYNLYGNYTYLRFLYIPENNEGKIEKILIL